MKLTLDLENLENLLQGTLEENMEEAIEREVNTAAHEYIENTIKEKIELIVSDKIETVINDWFENKEITIGGGFGEKGKAETYKVMDYVEKVISERLEKGIIERKVERRYGEPQIERVSFADYVDEKLRIETNVKSKFDKELVKIKDDINNKITGIFDKSTKDMLSDAVLNILVQNDTYKKIQENVSTLANKN